MNRVVSFFLTLLLAGAAHAQMQPYMVQGTFSDGGTFSGTFDYDPAADSYSNVDIGGATEAAVGIFDITSVGGTTVPPEGGYPDEFAPIMCNEVCRAGAGDGGTPTELDLEYAVDIFDTVMVVDWSNALNGPAGGAQQPITGGYETWECPGGATCSVTRQITSGFILPLTVANITALQAKVADQAAQLNATVASLRNQLAAITYERDEYINLFRVADQEIAELERKK